MHHIRFTRHAQELGFSLKEIEDLLTLRADPGSDCANVRERAAAKLEDVKLKIKRLRRIQMALESVIAACPGTGALDGCSIIEAMEGMGQR